MNPRARATGAIAADPEHRDNIVVAIAALLL
jgi:hypothetical protein